MQVLTKNNAPTIVQAEDRPAQYEGVAIYLGEPNDSSASWEIRVFARTGEGKALVATLVTAPPANTSGLGIPGERLIAIVGAAAEEFEADARIITGAANVPQNPRLWLVHRKECRAGVIRPLERWYMSAGINGAVNVPAGARIKAVGAFSTAGGTVQVGAGNPVQTVPAGVAWTVTPEGELIGPQTVTFVGTDAYTIELLVG